MPSLLETLDGANQGGGWPEVNLPASGDLSAYQWHLMTIDSNLDVGVLGAGAGGWEIGVLQNAPAKVGETARVRTGGVTRVYLGGTVSKGDLLRPSTADAGRIVTLGTASPAYVAGIALEAGVSGDKILAWLRFHRSPKSLARTLFASATQQGNAILTETNLFSFSVPGGTLAVDLQSLSFNASGTFGAVASVDKRLRVYFGATTILDTGALGAGAESKKWTVEGQIIRTGAATQKAMAKLNTSFATLAAYADFTSPTETLSGAVTLRVSGYGTNANDVVGEFWKGAWEPEP